MLGYNQTNQENKKEISNYRDYVRIAKNDVTMKTTHKYRKLIVLTVIFSIIIIVVFCLERKNYTVTDDLSITVQSDNRTESLFFWDSGEGKLYCFLPSYAELKRCQLQSKSNVNVTIQGKPIELFQNLGEITADVPYALNWGGDEQTITFMQSARIPTLFLTTQSGNKRGIDGDKEYEEKISLTLYNPVGEVEYSSKSYKDTINGRGNSTWKLEKKPYVIKTESACSLLGLPAADKWILLANGYDESGIRNKLAYQMAHCAEFEWSPSGEFVDVYINGDYEGVYLLSEKVEILENRLNQDKNATALFSRDLPSRWDSQESVFYTKSGKSLGIYYPTSQEKQFKQAKGKTTEMMQTIEELLNAESDEVFNLIDLDSWVKRYLMDETLLNRDGEWFSSYYYWNYTLPNEKVYAGPIWDYDLSLGNTNNEWSKLWGTPNRLICDVTPWYTQLMRMEKFHDRAVELYKTVFRPQLCAMADGTINDLSEQICFAVQMNDIRWKNELPHTYGSTEEATKGLREFLTERIAFLDDIWLNSENYHLVRFVGGSSYNIRIADGDYLQFLPTGENVDIEGEVIWITEGTNEIFDIGTLISDDIVLCAKRVNQTPETTENSLWMKIKNFYSLHRPIAEAFVWCAIFGIIGIGLVEADVRKRR